MFLRMSFSMKVLVSGGAGYIGAHVVRTLAAREHQPIILDDFRTSSESRAGDFPVEKIALEDTQSVLAVLTSTTQRPSSTWGDTSV